MGRSSVPFETDGTFATHSRHSVLPPCCHGRPSAAPGLERYSKPGDQGAAIHETDARAMINGQRDHLLPHAAGGVLLPRV